MFFNTVQHAIVYVEEIADTFKLTGMLYLYLL